MVRSRKITSRRWSVAAASEQAAELAQRLKTSPLVAQVLLNRGIDDPTAGLAFLRPNLRLLHDPAQIPGLADAAQRVARAIRDREAIVIYGDYDVDGITAVAILWHAIRLLGGNVRYYIPHRIDEGYGLNAEAVRQLCDDGAQLIITVDCGITAIEPVALAKDRGVDVVVTDHHEWKETPPGESGGAGEIHLPPAAHVVHPRLAGSTYPNPHRCGSGVAFKLAWGVGQAMTGGAKVSEALKAFLVEAMALAALGTIADVVPLVGENRILAHFGLGGLKQTQLVGLRALIDSADLDGKNIDSFHVGFLLAPRLNAAGRMGHARLAVEMLTDASEERALEIATYLESQNKQRQATERQILDQALQQIEQLQMLERDCRAIVVGGAEWHPGVIGIVASRIVDRFHRPAIVVAMEQELGHGSGRSIDGFHLSKGLEAVTHTLESHGGHEMAAGLRVRSERFEAFREAFTAHVAEALDPTLLIPELRVDCDAELGAITEALVGDFARLGPFGRGNPRPVIRCRDVVLTADARRIGKTGDHLSLFVRSRSAGGPMKAIAFGAGDWCDRLKAGSVIHLACQPQINEFNGRRSVELEVKDLQLAE
ncbi:MAG: single-stranded-DNA-specific exonuclease RecJ [Tepidisphaeraceae bacterium]